VRPQSSPQDVISTGHTNASPDKNGSYGEKRSYDDSDWQAGIHSFFKLLTNTPIQGMAAFVLRGECMSELAVSVPKVRPMDVSGADLSTEEFLRVFNELRVELVSTLFFMLGNHEDAQDAAQDAFLKCWRTRESLADVQNIRAWIFRVGLNTAKDLQRSAWRRHAKPLLGECTLPSRDGDSSPTDALEEKEVLDRLRLALVELRAEEKAVFLLRQNGDLTYEEIAKQRRLPVGTVKTQMRSALQKLRRVLKDK
jgi:RNA polymerase sigma-70 factor, ECF subfamily